MPVFLKPFPVLLVPSPFSSLPREGASSLTTGPILGSKSLPHPYFLLVGALGFQGPNSWSIIGHPSPNTHRSRSSWSQSHCRSPRWWSPGGSGRRRGCPVLSGSRSGLGPRPFPVTPTLGHAGRVPELRPALPATPPWP